MPSEHEISYLDKLEADVAQAIAEFPKNYRAERAKGPDWTIKLRVSHQTRDVLMPGCVSADFDRGFAGTTKIASPFSEGAELEDWKRKVDDLGVEIPWPNRHPARPGN